MDITLSGLWLLSGALLLLSLLLVSYQIDGVRTAKLSTTESQSPISEAGFDCSDAFHQHAYIVMYFQCTVCNAYFDFNSEHELPGDEWCVGLAEQVRAAGWRIPDTTDSEASSYCVYCPQCVQVLRLTSQTC